MDCAIQGCSQAVVEGIADAPPLDLTPQLPQFSPLCFYLTASALWMAWLLQRRATDAIEHATRDAFRFHIAWYVWAVMVFIVDGPQVECSIVGKIFYAAGTWLAVILMSVFLLSWSKWDDKAKIKPSTENIAV